MDGKPALKLDDGEVILIPYADNLNVAGIDEQRMQDIKNKIVRYLRDVGFRVYEEMEACAIGQSLGFFIDGTQGLVAPIPFRLKKVCLALKWLSTCLKVFGKQMERLLGHCVHLILLRCKLLSIFRSLYDFIQSSYYVRRRFFSFCCMGGSMGQSPFGTLQC